MRGKSASELAIVGLVVALVAAWGFSVVVGGPGVGAVGLGAGAQASVVSEAQPTVAPELSVPASCTDHVTAENHADNAIQSTINGAAPGAVICIGPGTFPEQLVISTPDLTIAGNGNGSTILAPSAPLSVDTVDFDSSSTYADLTPAAAIVLVENTTDVTIEDLQVSGANAASTFTGCGVDYYGVDFQNSSGTLSGATVTGIELPQSLFGCGPGVAVYAYNGYFLTGTAPSPAVAVTVSDSTITSYDKGGVVCDDLGEACTIVDNSVEGIGGTTLIAQNGIQVAYGASAAVDGNLVSGDHYTGNFPANIDYFAPYYQSAGILVYDAGNALEANSNVLRGNDLGIAVLGTARATVSDNRVLQGYSYGITLDLNATLAYLGFPVYSTDLPWVTTASGDSIANVNVGLLVYDDNVTVSGGTMTDVNVSVESVLDQPAPSYAITLDSLSAEANVSGALLGNISSFQATPGMTPLNVGTYTLSGDSFVAGPTPPPAGDLNGIALNGSSVTVARTSVSGFDLGISVNPLTATATVEDSTVSVPASLGEPGFGIWVGNYAPDPTTETTGTVAIVRDTVTGPGGATDSPLAGGTGIIAGGAVVTVTDNVVSDFSAVYGSTPTNTTGPGSGYDWWQGTQSAGVMVACAPSTPASSCLVERNTLTDNTIGIIALLTNSAFSGTWQAGPETIASNTIDDSGGYGIYTSLGGQGGGAAQTSIIADNTIDNTLTGAPALYLAGQGYDVSNNVFVGTSISGTQGPVMGEGGPSIDTSTVMATDYYDYPYDWTTVTLNANLFLDTDVYCSSSFVPGSESSIACGQFVTFTESGLPSGLPWSIGLNGTVSSVDAPASIVGDVVNGTSPYTVGSVAGYVASPTGGTLSVSGANLTVLIAFTGPYYGVTFTESGLPAADTWYVIISGGPSLSGPGTETTLGVSLLNGAYRFTIASDDSSYAPSSSSGSFTVSGAIVNVPAIEFEPVAITFEETGLAAGTAWSVTLSGVPFSTTANVIVFSPEPAGVYPYTVGAIAGYSVTPRSGSVTLNGASKTVPITFTVVTYAVTVREAGLPFGKTWTVAAGGTVVNTTLSSVTIPLPNGSYSYFVKGPSGWGVLSIPPAGPLTVAASPVTISFTFGRAQTYTLTFSEAGLARGETWCVRLAWLECTRASHLSLANLTPGAYPYAVVSPLAGQHITATVGTTLYPLSGTITVAKSLTMKLVFAYDYLVTFSETGAPAGTWSVTIGTTTLTNGTGDPIVFQLANGTYTYHIGAISGYSSAGLPKRVLVSGAAANVAVTFTKKVPVPHLEEVAAAAARLEAPLKALAGVAGVATTVGLSAAALLGLLGVAWVLARSGRRPGDESPR